MANPQPTDAHLRMAHSIQEQLMVSDFTEQQRRILDLILRLSWGCGCKVAYIPRQNTFEVVGVGENKIKQHLDWLERANVIGRQGCYYWFKKDFDHWRVSRSLEYAPEKLAELVSINLEKLAEKGSFIDVNLPKREVETSLIGKNELAEKGSHSDTNLASSKEILNKVLNKEVSEDITTTKGEIIKAPDFWQRTLTDLKGRITPANYNTWLANTIGLGAENSTFFVVSPDKFNAEEVQRRFEAQVVKSLGIVSGKQYGVCFVAL